VAHESLEYGIGPGAAVRTTEPPQRVDVRAGEPRPDRALVVDGIACLRWAGVATRIARVVRRQRA